MGNIKTIETIVTIDAIDAIETIKTIAAIEVYISNFNFQLSTCHIFFASVLG